MQYVAEYNSTALTHKANVNQHGGRYRANKQCDWVFGVTNIFVCKTIQKFH